MACKPCEAAKQAQIAQKQGQPQPEPQQEQLPKPPAGQVIVRKADGSIVLITPKKA